MTETYTWECKSGELQVSDPGYEKKHGTDDGSGWLLAKHLTNVKRGTWTTELEIDDILDWGKRVCKSVSYIGKKSVKGTVEKISLGVDSGQMSVVDREIYPDGDDTGNYEDKNSFYSKACQLTTESYGGVIDGRGVVSRSGIGDGMYDVIVVRNNNNQVVKVKINFVGEREKTLYASSLVQD
jgi:hypothetical protein